MCDSKPLLRDALLQGEPRSDSARPQPLPLQTLPCHSHTSPTLLLPPGAPTRDLAASLLERVWGMQFVGPWPLQHRTERRRVGTQLTVNRQMTSGGSDWSQSSGPAKDSSCLRGAGVASQERTKQQTRGHSSQLQRRARPPGPPQVGSGTWLSHLLRLNK